MTPISIRDAQFNVTGRRNASFWETAASQNWEPETFDILDRCITRDTTVLDVGAWIGPTALYSACRARQVYAFEPDPVAYAELKENISCNPQLRNIEAINAAVAEEPGVVQMGANYATGDSGSSILRAGNAETWSVPAIRLDDFLRDRGVEGSLFIKMDIEGYEYRVLPSLIDALRGKDYILYLSTHPHILWESMPGGGAVTRIARRASMIQSQWQILRKLRGLHFIGDSQLRPLRWRAVLPPLLRGQAVTPDRSLVAASLRDP